MCRQKGNWRYFDTVYESEKNLQRPYTVCRGYRIHTVCRGYGIHDTKYFVLAEKFETMTKNRTGYRTPMR